MPATRSACSSRWFRRRSPRCSRSRSSARAFLPIFSGYGADAVAIRLEDAGAVALITADGFTRRGRVVPMKETADAAVAQVPSVHTVVVVPRLGRTDVPMQQGRDVTLAA